MTELLPLTADTLKALRNADSVSFHHTPEIDGLPTYIRASKRVDPKDGFGPREIDVEIAADVMWTIYDRNGDTGRSMPTRAFWSFHACKFHAEWVTFTQLLKVGDRLVLHWMSDSSETLTNAGFTTCRFGIDVRRTVGKAAKEQRLTFLLDARTEKRTSDFYLTYTREYELNT